VEGRRDTAATGEVRMELRRGGVWGGAWPRVKAYAETTKFRSVVLLATGTVVGGAVGLGSLVGTSPAFSVGPGLGFLAGPLLEAALAAARSRVLWAVLAAVLGCAGANAVTGYIDRRMDAVMERTRHRPLPTGRLEPWESLWFGLALIGAAAAVAALKTNLWTLAWLAFGVLDSTAVYNGLTKPRTPLNVILGSPAGGAPVMMGAAAATGGALDPVALLVAALVVAWTPVHIWSLAIRHVDDYRRAGVPMLPVVVGVPKAARCVGWSSLALCATAVALALVARFSSAAVALTLVLQVPVVAGSLQVMRDPAPDRARRLFKLSSPYLAACFLLAAWQSLV